MPFAFAGVALAFAALGFVAVFVSDFGDVAFAARRKEIPCEGAVTLGGFEDKDGLAVVFSHHPTETELGADLAFAGTATDAEPFVSGGGNNTFVPDIIARNPVAVFVDQVGKFSLFSNKCGKRAGNIEPR